MKEPKTPPAADLLALLAALLILAAFPPAARAQNATMAPKAGHLSIQVENDLWGSGADRHYTHGTKISYMQPKGAPRWLVAKLDRVPLFKQQGTTLMEISIGQNLFTPDDIERTDLIANDRPFAGWLYASLAALALIENRQNYRSGNSLELTLGIVGPSALGEGVQREVHKIVDTRTPRGWDHQLQDEPGLILTYSRVWEQFFRPPKLWAEASIMPHLTAALGNIYTYAGTGLLLRLGRHLRYDFCPPTISPGFPGTAYFSRGSDFSCYFFAGVEGRVMGRNIFLDGNTFEDSHSVDKNLLVADFQAGLALRYKNLRLSFSNVFRTKEFKGQEQISEYGAVNLTAMY